MKFISYIFIAIKLYFLLGHVQCDSPCGKELMDIAVFPDDPRYTDVTHIWNSAYSNILPAFVALPATVQDVQRCLACAYQYNVPFTMKSGGHSANGMSTINGSNDGAFVIYLAKMRAVDKVVQETVTVQAGATWQDIYSEVKKTNYLIAGGDSATVGVAGYTLGGGRSIISRMYGLGIDNVLSFTVVTAAGTDVVIANSTTNTDLYWALRGGGGGNFGIVVNITFKLQPSFSSYTFGYITFEGLDTIQQVLSILGSDDDFDTTFSMEVLLRPGNKLNLTYTSLGPISSFTFGKLIVFEKLSSFFWSNSYSTFWEAFDARFPVHLLLGNGVPYIVRACLLKTISPTTAELLLKVVTPDQCFHNFNQLGGKTAEYAANTTAYPFRSSEFEIFSICNYQDSSEKDLNNKYLHRLYSSLGAACDGNYVNDPETDLHNWQTKYYGDNYPRLVDIQKKWNPLDKGTYHYLQSIGSSYNPPELYV